MSVYVTDHINKLKIGQYVMKKIFKIAFISCSFCEGLEIKKLITIYSKFLTKKQNKIENWGLNGNVFEIMQINYFCFIIP